MNYYHPATRKVFTRAIMDRMGLPADVAALAALGYYPIEYAYPPHDEWREQMLPSGPPEPRDDGQSYVQNFLVQPLDTEHLAASLARYREAALGRLHAAWLEAEGNGKLQSAAGFVIDANERANRDIGGLITMLEASGGSGATFCAADNTMHPVTLEQLRAMRLEVISYGQRLYAAKWAMRAALESAASFDEVDAVNISFEDV